MGECVGRLQDFGLRLVARMVLGRPLEERESIPQCACRQWPDTFGVVVYSVSDIGVRWNQSARIGWFRALAVGFMVFQSG